MKHPTDEEIQDFSDEALTPDDQSKLQAHLSSCLSCRESLSAIEALKASARLLATDVQPPSGEWEAIEARLSPRVRQDLRRPKRSDVLSPSAPSPRWQVVVGRAAAILAIGIGVGVVGLTIRGGSNPSGSDLAGQPGEPGRSGAAGADFAQLLEGAYAPSISELQQAFEQGGAQLQPETLVILRENLEIIDEAILRAQEALASDPASAPAGRSLGSLYGAKVALLQRAAKLAQGI